jgi:L-2-hydroxyglutarate oxidase LhgO
MESISCDICVIGAGVLGLAVAARLSESAEVILVERHPGFGRETSSRNSEVVHSGIYYPVTSAKTKWCLRGRELLYRFCAERGVGCRKIGKLVVASAGDPTDYLEKIAAHSRELGVPCSPWDSKALAAVEPLVQAENALFFPETGIVDSHQMMAALEQEFMARGGTLAYRHEMTGVAFDGSNWILEVRSDGSSFRIKSPVVVNCAGLAAAEISNRFLGTKEYHHRYCRGRYFTLHNRYRDRFRHLIYPIPVKDGLGIHLTLDLAGGVRFGPDVDWAAGDPAYADLSHFYDCDWDSLRPSFLAAIQRYCPAIQPEDLDPGFTGVRPKLFVGGKEHRDFLVEHRRRFWHCLGIESPGLTACLAIAEHIAVEIV